MFIAHASPPAIVIHNDNGDAQMTQAQRCAGSNYQVGDVFPWGNVVYVSPIVDKQDRVVGWVYASDHGNLTVEANAYMSEQDRSLAGIKYLGPMMYRFTKNPWSDLKIYACPNNLITKQ